MPKVSIVTRTKNRALLLARALASVGAQHFSDWEHLVVNDGGDPAPVDRLCGGEPRRRVIHNPKSLGMEAASNVALRQARGEYVVIHDDDDSWDPEFLAATVEFLDGAGPIFGGVITHATRIRERIDDERITFLDASPVNDWLENVTLFRLAVNNPFPPISFLYRRAILDEIGYYREDLPVVGDWEFNLRVASRWEIGLIRRPLARYHQRATLMNGVYANSVIGGGDEIRRWEARIRNELLRRDLAAGRMGIGFLVNVAPSLEELRNRRVETAFSYVKDTVWNLGTRIGLIRVDGKS